MLKLCVTFVVLNLIISCCGFVTNTRNLAIIGTGPSGLVAAKYAIAQGFNVTVYEQNDVIGGVWWYTDEIGKNKYGIPIHTSMYNGLRTNVPIQMMEYSDHVYGKNIVLFPHRKDIWNYLNSYANRFDVKKYIEFNHLVTNVIPIESGKWKVVVNDLPNNKFKSNVFDAIIVCNGHNSMPKIPLFDGADTFSGKILHSHDFRNADTFTGENVLIIGSGSSGIDLVALLSATANRVTRSRRSSAATFPYKNVTYKGEEKRFTKTGAEFVDGSDETFTVVFYATGYSYSFPFLTNDSGITVDENNSVHPLYKYIFNIKHPTMAFIRVPSGLLPTFPTIESQVLFALQFLSGNKSLPSKSEMLEDIQNQMAAHWNRFHSNRAQFMELEHREYFEQLQNLTSIDIPPEVISTIYLDNDAMRKGDPTTFRKYRYIILDDIRYIKTKYEN